MRWVAAGRAPAPSDNDDNDDNEKRGIPDNPPQQRTQGKNTPFGNPLTPMICITHMQVDMGPQSGPKVTPRSTSYAIDDP